MHYLSTSAPLSYSLLFSESPSTSIYLLLLSTLLTITPISTLLHKHNHSIAPPPTKLSSNNLSDIPSREVMERSSIKGLLLAEKEKWNKLRQVLALFYSLATTTIQNTGQKMRNLLVDSDLKAHTHKLLTVLEDSSAHNYADYAAKLIFTAIRCCREPPFLRPPDLPSPHILQLLSNLDIELDNTQASDIDIQPLLLRLVQEELDVDSMRSQFFIIKLFIFTSLNRNGTLLTPDLMTPQIAKAEYLLRAAVAIEIHRPESERSFPSSS